MRSDRCPCGQFPPHRFRTTIPRARRGAVRPAATRIGSGCLWAACALGPTGVSAGLESRGQNFPLEIPTPEVAPGASLPTVGAQDEGVAVIGQPSGELVMITLEGRK